MLEPPAHVVKEPLTVVLLDQHRISTLRDDASKQPLSLKRVGALETCCGFAATVDDETNGNDHMQDGKQGGHSAPILATQLRALAERLHQLTDVQFTRIHDDLRNVIAMLEIVLARGMAPMPTD